MGTGRMKKFFRKGMAGALVMSLFFSMAGNHADLWTIKAQAAEERNNVISIGSTGAAIKTDGSLWVWGANSSGWLGNGTKEDIFVPVKIMEDVKEISIGSTSAAIKTDGSLWMWGNNNFGQLGNGTKEDSSVPVKVMENVKKISIDDEISAAIKTDGSLWMWGSNRSGQLGNGTREDSSVPVKIMENVKEISNFGSESYYSITAVIKTDGSLWMWGSNYFGELGNGTMENSSVPVKVMENVKKISVNVFSFTSPYYTGQVFTPAAIKTDGSLWTWGFNYYGQLGNGTTEESSVPVKVMENVKGLPSFGSISAAIKEDGSLWMWGRNNHGQLGNGTTEDSYVPVQTMPPGSISTSGSTDPDDPNPPAPDDPDIPDSAAIFIDETAGPVIKVVDSAGKPIKDATVYYRSMYSYKTSNKGMVTLEGYLPGKEVLISKTGYENKIISGFVKSETGISTYTLSKAKGSGSEGGTEDTIAEKLADLAEGVYLVKDEEIIDLITEEAQINTYYKNSLTDNHFDIVFKSQKEYDMYTLYSGKRAVALNTTGEFRKLELARFSADEPVYLVIREGNKPDIQKKLNLHVVNISPPVNDIHIGDDISVVIPDNIPIVGGETIQLDLESLPLECNFKTDGSIQVGVNIGGLAKNTKEFSQTISRLRNANADSVRGMLDESRADSPDSESTKKSIKPEFTIIGYLEGYMKEEYLQGKLFVEVSLEYSKENQLSVGPVPVVVEVAIKGKMNADGSISCSAEKGVSGSVGVGGGIELGLYAGLGIADVVSAGIYGSGEFGMHFVFLPEDSRGLDSAYVSGAVGLEAKLLGMAYKLSLLSGRYDIIGNGVSALSDERSGYSGFALDDYDAYHSLGRSYLTADGSMSEWMPDNSSYANGVAKETVLQNASCLDTIPQVVRMGDTVMLFYLTDAGVGRNAANRSMLVYSLWDETKETWGEPQAVLDDGTADYAPDLYTDGKKIYAVWQDAREKLTDGLSLEETARQMTLHAAVYDAEQNLFRDLGMIESENDLFQQNPQILADENGVSVYWYENAQDNVLGLSGTNRIYRAALTGQSVLAEGLQTAGIAEEETEQETPETEKSVSENTASAFRKFVALTEETLGQETMTQEESVSENTTPEDGDESNMPPVDSGEEEDKEEENKDPVEGEVTEEEPSDGGDAEPEKEEETVSENTLPEETVSENTISENTVQVNTYSVAEQADGPWTVTFLQEEGNCIFSADAGKMNGKAGYAFVAGTMDQYYHVEESRVVFLENGQRRSEVLESGTAEKVEFSPVYAGETLTWFEAGDIHYIDGNGSAAALFGESRIPSWSYTLLSDGTSTEVFFPVNADGKANLYRIGRENGAFLPALQVTDQEDYVQYADGFVKDGQAILVYNRMKVNDELEEVNNSLCTGTIAHSYYDIAMHSAGSMVLYNEETGEDELEITAQLYNNGTVKAENLNLALCGPDGSMLENVQIDAVLEPGEEKNISAVYPMEKITEEAEYTLTLSGAEETNQENNNVKLTLGSASLQVESKVISVADTRTIQAGIRNTGMTACGGTVSVRDMETGEEYCSGTFEPIEKGKTTVVEAEIAPSILKEKAELALEVVVIPDQEKVDTVKDFVVVYAPSYEVNFVTDTGTTTVYADYGTQISFPENPVKEGKHFIGWYDAENPSAGTLYTEETSVTKDLTLYACFADEERAQIPLSECSVSSIPMQYYTGGQLKPKVTVKWGSEVLKADRDYKVTYRNNKEQGQATAIITAVTGNGKKYTGSIERSFSIMYPTSKVSVKAIPAVNFDGTSHTPEPVVTYQKKTLVKDRDYTVSYFNNRNAGTASVTITGKGTFSGTKTVTFQIKGTAISGMKFDKIPDVTYNGKNTRPIVTVMTKDGKTQLMSGSDYRLVYENTVNKGTATVTVIGNGNYTGTKKLTYKVVAKPLAESMVSVEQPSAVTEGQPAAASLVVMPEKAEYTYTGKPIKPVLIIADEAAGDTMLVPNKDYTVSYSKNNTVGEAQITVKGKGNYSGTLKIPFTIAPVDLAKAETAGTIDVRVNDIAYTGKALKPSVQVYETVGGKEKKIPASGYTLSYANNTEKGTGTVTVAGKEKSGYTGTVTANFRIVDKAKLLSASAIKIDAIPGQTFTGSEVEPALHIVDKSDKNKEVTLEKGTHYEVTYRNNVNAGKATVTVRGIGSYAGSRNVAFKINKCAIADKDVLGAGFTVENPADMKYTGYALKPDVVLKDKGVTLVQGKDYKLSYKNNTKIGTVSVTVQGIGNYSGSYKAISFQIKAWDYNTLTAEIEDQTYTGKALKPQVKFYMTGKNGREEILLKPNTAVKIAYKDNTNVGTATVTITGKGELDKITPITATFGIEQADLNEAVVSRIPNQTLKGVAVKPIPKVKVGKNSLKAGRDFTTSYQRNGVKGEATVVIKGIGNYTGECRKTFIVQ